LFAGSAFFVSSETVYLTTLPLLLLYGWCSAGNLAVQAFPISYPGGELKHACSYNGTAIIALPPSMMLLQALEEVTMGSSKINH
jgi:hypothetical protein